MALSFKGTFPARNKEEASGADSLNQADSLADAPGPGELNEQLELLTLALYDLTAKLDRLAGQPNQETSAFREVLDEVSADLPAYREIYAAYDAGRRDLGELAREFNRGKGELELILNLRKSKKP